MSYEKYRKDIYLAVLGTNDHDSGKIVKVLANVGYQVNVFASEEALLESLSLGPPHILLFDITAQPAEQPFAIVEKIRKISPETLFILIVPQLHQFHLQVGIDLIYDVITRPILTAEVLRPVDRATEKLLLQYHVESLRTKLTRPSTAPPPASVDERLPEEVFAESALAQANAYSLVRQFLDSISKKRDLTSIVQEYVQQISQILDDQPVLYFKYLKYKFSLVISATARIPFETVRGVGLRFKGMTPQQQQDLLQYPEKAGDLAKLIREVFAQQEFYATPLINSSEIAGVFVFLVRDLTPEQSQLVRFLTNLLELVYYRNTLEVKLHSLNVYDEVTQVFGQKYLDQRMREEVIRARRIELPVSLIRLTVDQYDDCAERLGKTAAEIVMQMVAMIMRDTSRVNDLLGRTARNEFALILPHTDGHGAAVRAERLRRMIEGARFPNIGDLLEGPITISSGVSEYPSIGDDAENIFRQAGEALDQVRDVGGNKVCLAVSAPGHQPDFMVKKNTW